jgi:hypothetical protein
VWPQHIIQTFLAEHFSLAVKGLLLVIERALDKTVSEG